MVRQNLNWFLKILGNLGSKLYYKITPKINFMMLILIVRATIKEYMEIYNGSMETALNKMRDDVAIEATSVLAELINNPVLLGIKMSIILTPNISDHAFFIHLALKALIGEKAVNKLPTME
ncbi:MAG: hypothetical protein ACTSRP_28475 [Candidatus Helarchaeota archaeon]